MKISSVLHWIDSQLQKLSWVDRIVILLCFITSIGVLTISTTIFENIPHIEDEFTYVWQAEVAARGEISRPNPDCPRCFMVPFVVDYNGQRFGKYQLPWPVVLSFGIRLGARKLVNPILAGICVWLMYLLIRKLHMKQTGLIGAILMASSPFFLINASTLLSHVFSLLLTLVFFISWFDLVLRKNQLPYWLPIATAGLSLGLLILSRPLTAVGIAIPFALHGLAILLRGSYKQKKAIVWVGAIVIMMLPIHFLWQFSLTGDFFKNPYTLVWPYDTIGFGEGIGRQTAGYQPRMAIGNARSGLYVGMFDLFGWLKYSWILMPVGLIATLRNSKGLLVSLTAITVVAAYTLYWIGSNLFGPRYYFEALPACVYLTALALSLLAGYPAKLRGSSFWKSWRTWRFTFITAIFTLAILSTLLFYLPQRLPRFYQLYGATAAKLVPFINNRTSKLTPALIIVHIADGWTDYSTLTELSNPYFDTPFVFSITKGKESNTLATAMFPTRSVWHYYFDEPAILRSTSR